MEIEQSEHIPEQKILTEEEIKSIEKELAKLESSRNNMNNMLERFEKTEGFAEAAIQGMRNAIAQIDASIAELSKTIDKEITSEKTIPERELIEIEPDIVDMSKDEDGFYDFKLPDEMIIEIAYRTAEVHESVKDFLEKNGKPEKSIVEAGESVSVYGEINSDEKDSVAMRFQIERANIDVEIPLLDEERHSIFQKAAIIELDAKEISQADTKESKFEKKEPEYEQLMFDLDF